MPKDVDALEDFGRELGALAADIAKQVAGDETRAMLAEGLGRLEGAMRFALDRIDDINARVTKVMAALDVVDPSRAMATYREATEEAALAKRTLGRVQDELAEARKTFGGLDQTAEDFAKSINAVSKSIEAASAGMTEARAAVDVDLAKAAEQFESRFEAMAEALQATVVKMRVDQPERGVALKGHLGPYVPGETYRPGEMVMYHGSTWFAKRDTGETPAAKQESAWGLFAAAGIKGAN